ncbi:YndJ-like protein [Halobacillus karajensis]|uniref:YndJ-like protein n=1 Tax=Halobacillus karajensis TaxID=195088 RepID=A0A024P981_9BACI|nr:YndJ family transporter [Halobacillus karajensis]CDQ21571.1 hypothetical protein BN982_03974 [Halobacillus karajensis]CDQ25505.1 hypothetical protein BN983_03852 [Halobacillus karajensis]CDQ28964.1 hypothetical protein BN981_03307 [Halobacillus karajensis]SEI08860.1 YndJ-like protein [Halobacillus karajensis]
MRKPGRWLAVVGFFLWMVWKITLPVGWLEFSIGFSLFVLLPLLLEEAVQKPHANKAEQWLWQCLVCLFPFAVSGVLSLSLPPGWEGVGWGGLWFIYTILIAVGGCWRIRFRNVVQVEEVSIDVGFLYLAVGGLFLFLSRFPIGGFGPFSDRELTILALFFHGVAFLLALVTGFFGRYRMRSGGADPLAVDWPYRVLVGATLISPLIVFFSLWYGREAIIFSVVLFPLLIAWMCLWWFWLSVEFKPWVQTAMILSVLMGASIIGGAFWRGWSLGRLSSVGMIALIPPYGFFSALLFSWLIVFAWRGVEKSRRLLTPGQLKKE